MRKILPLLVIGTLLASGAAALPDVKQKKITLSFSKPILVEDNGSLIPKVKEANSVSMHGYMIPVHEEVLVFPFKTKIESIECIPKNVHKEKISKKLAVAPPPVPIGFKKVAKENVKPLTINTWYDYNIGTGIQNGKRVVFVKINVYPVRYLPTKNTIEWAEDFDLFINYKESKPVYKEEYSLIILVPSTFKNALQELVNHKNNRGISTKLVTLREIYNGIYFRVQGRDDQEKIKYFIKSAIENWGTSYVLLVGGRVEIPTRTVHINVDNEDMELFVSDLYYADIYDKDGEFSSWDSNNNDIFGEYQWGDSGLTDKLDLYPDVYLGRLVCTSEYQVNTCVNKIIKYEKNKAYTKNWFNNLVVVGGDTFTSDPYYGDNSGINEGELVNEKIIEIMDGFIPNRIWASNGKLGGVNGVGSISEALNQGAGFVDFSGHGYLNVWATHPHNSSHSVWIPTPTGGYFTSHVNSLTNGDKLPIVIVGGCLTSKFNMRSDCFGWVFISNSKGGGIASFGATAKGYSYLGRGVTYGLIERIAINTFRAYRVQGATTVGEMWAKAIISYISARMGSIDYKTVEEWILFGDPSLVIGVESSPPKKPSRPEGPTDGKIRIEYTYSASTTDPEGDKIYYLFEWGDGEYSGWVGPYYSGQTAKASHIWLKKGEYYIRVKAKDEHGVQSSWSDPLPISMSRRVSLFNYLLRIWNLIL